MVGVSDGDRATLRRTIGAIWEGTLGEAPGDADDDFFESGGNSLKAVSFIGEVERQLGLDSLSPEDFYRSSTFGGIVSTIERNFHG